MTQLRRFYGGAVFSPPDHRDMMMGVRDWHALSLNNDVTALDTGEIWNQGHEGSCTAWSILDAVAAAYRKAGGVVPEKLSAAFQYWNSRKNQDGSFPQDAGASMRGAAQALVDLGCPYESQWPYEGSGAQADDLPPAEAFMAAGQHKLVTYLRIPGTGQALLNGALSAMQDGFPVWIAFNVYPSFENIGRDGRVPMRQSADYVLGGHAVTLWDSIADQSWAGGGSCDLKNQWSQAWGNNGRARVPWGYFLDNTIVEAWILKVMQWNDPGPIVPPEPAPVLWLPYLEDVRGIRDEGWRLIRLAQAEFEAAQNEGRPVTHGIMNAAVGPLGNYFDQTVADAESLVTYIPKVDPPPPPPPPPVSLITGVAVTYAQHDPAKDVYGGYSDDQVKWGPHHGLPFIAPADGVVTLYSFPTPLLPRLGMGDLHSGSAIDDALYQMNHDALFGGDFICGLSAVELRAIGQTMYFIVYQPDVPIQTSYGPFKVGWGGHARSNAKVGRVVKGDKYGESWDSGIHFEPGVPEARAAHVHACASATGNLTMNGDISGLAWCEVHGWKVAFIGSNGPGPTQYQQGAYCAGRLRSDFTAAGKQPPPMPS
jgi:hypothetical protein